MTYVSNHGSLPVLYSQFKSYLDITVQGWTDDSKYGKDATLREGNIRFSMPDDWNANAMDLLDIRMPNCFPVVTPKSYQSVMGIDVNPAKLHLYTLNEFLLKINEHPNITVAAGNDDITYTFTDTVSFPACNFWFWMGLLEGPMETKVYSAGDTKVVDEWAFLEGTKTIRLFCRQAKRGGYDNPLHVMHFKGSNKRNEYYFYNTSPYPRVRLNGQGDIELGFYDDMEKTTVQHDTLTKFRKFYSITVRLWDIENSARRDLI